MSAEGLLAECLVRRIKVGEMPQDVPDSVIDTFEAQTERVVREIYERGNLMLTPLSNAAVQHEGAIGVKPPPAFLTAETVKLGIIFPTLRQTANIDEKRNPLGFAQEFDRVYGMAHAVVPVSLAVLRARSNVERIALEGLNEQELSMVLRLPSQVVDQVAARTADISEEYYGLLVEDRTGFKIVDKAVENLTAKPGLGSPPLPGKPALFIRRVLVSGARSGNKLYKSIYPLAEEVLRKPLR